MNNLNKFSVISSNELEQIAGGKRKKKSALSHVGDAIGSFFGGLVKGLG